MARKPKPTSGNQPNNTLEVQQTPDETGAQAMARKLLEPHARHAVTAGAYSGKLLGSQLEPPGIMDFVGHLTSATSKAEAGDLAFATQMLTAQAITLDTMFTEFARRAALNMGEYVSAAESYGRLAFKAQSSSRATIEALAKMHQPREQTVRHVHVNEGGQAVIADQFHNHTGGGKNAENAKQSHATGAVGECPSLPSPNADWDGVPITGSAGQAAMPNARRHKRGRA